MSFFGVNDASTVSTLFSSLNSNSKGGSVSGTNFLADYASIRSGSYFKLLKTYYGSDSASSSRVSKLAEKNNAKTSTSVSKDATKKLTRIENSAEALKESADSLLAKGSKSVFNKVEVKQQDGTVKNDYDREAIYDKVNDFVKDYNRVIDNTEDTNTKSIQRNVDQMVDLTDSKEKALDEIGIRINTDDTLSIDKDTFMKADMEKVKRLFSGSGSYGYSVSAKASMIDYQAHNEVSKANTYGRSGSYSSNYSYGSNYSSYI
ncbi:hypothetical protein D3Z36_14015 [Lachnospiraceae bacterium]|nr:hypothetical protein [Lachnospiraceae bacterium]